MENVLLKIKRQDDPDDLPYWEVFEVQVEPCMSVAEALALIRENPVTAEGMPTPPTAHDCSCMQGLCGACTMQINGRSRLACKTLVSEFDGPISLEPLSKFPIIRDLKVDRLGMLNALASSECWMPIDGLLAHEFIPSVASESFENASIFFDCIMCGACSEACPQVNKRSFFAGAFVFSHAISLNRNPSGERGANSRLSALARRGGVADCAGVENCERICPRGIPLTKAAAMLQWDVTLHSIKSFFR